MIKNIKNTYNVIKSKLRDIGVKSKRSKHWSKLQKDFLLENPVCAICGTKTRLNVHHKKPFHLYPELELDRENLITLCMSKKECHLLIGHGNNFKRYSHNIDEYVNLITTHEKSFDEICVLAKAQSLKG